MQEIKMKLEDINISLHTGGDSCGKVFFYKERVLRAISPQSEQWVREFLASELYGKLVEEGWFVKTWIVDDVQLDGHPLIVESERVYACQWQLLTFEQLRDICVHAIKINALCKQYGWVLSDIFFTNFGLKNGQICYFDLGGFSRIGKQPELKRFIEKWERLRLMSLGMTTLARNSREWLKPANNDALYPVIRTKLDEYLELFVFHPFGKKYNVYRKKSKPAIFSIRTRFAHSVINGINRIAELISKKPYPWRLFYVEPAFTLTEKDFERIIPYYCGYTDVKYEDNGIIKYFINQISSADDKPKSIMLYGEYRIEDIELLRQAYQGQIWVCSPLLPYTDSIYKEIRERRIDIGVLSYNFSYNTIQDNEKIIELDLDGLLCHVINLPIASNISNLLGKMRKYFKQVYVDYGGGGCVCQ